ncbi:hypothetical protein, partial [Rathayibacter rathayi]|uniref:hypothetical protein n=1 Tax=Rathayibacter rathayi TaxID=33887 RepID=UPI001CA514FF
MVDLVFARLQDVKGPEGAGASSAQKAGSVRAERRTISDDSGQWTVGEEEGVGTGASRSPPVGLVES